MVLRFKDILNDELINKASVVFIFGDKLGFPQVKMISTKYRVVICAIIVLAAIIDFGFVKTVILG